MVCSIHARFSRNPSGRLSGEAHNRPFVSFEGAPVCIRASVPCGTKGRHPKGRDRRDVRRFASRATAGILSRPAGEGPGNFFLRAVYHTREKKRTSEGACKIPGETLKCPPRPDPWPLLPWFIGLVHKPAVFMNQGIFVDSGAWERIFSRDIHPLGRSALPRMKGWKAKSAAHGRDSRQGDVKKALG